MPFYLLFFTVISSFILLNLFSPMPFTCFISSINLNFPFSFLYSIIFKAVDSPIPGKVSKSVLVAVFIFIFNFLLLLLFISLLCPTVAESILLSTFIVDCFTYLLGICFFIPSSMIYAKFIFVISASSFNPPALSIASIILELFFNSTIPSLFTAPLT